MTLTSNRLRATHMQKFKVNSQSVPKTEWKQTDGQTDWRRWLHYLPPNAVGKSRKFGKVWACGFSDMRTQTTHKTRWTLSIVRDEPETVSFVHRNVKASSAPTNDKYNWYNSPSLSVQEIASIHFRYSIILLQHKSEQFGLQTCVKCYLQASNIVAGKERVKKVRTVHFRDTFLNLAWW